MKSNTFSIILFLMVFVIFFSCGKNNKSNRNDKVINQKTFTQILIKIHLTDALLSKNNLSDAMYTKDSLSYYNQIFKEFKISREKFYFSLNYYTEHIDKFQNIQKTVTDSLKAKYDLIDSLEKISLKKQDLWKLKRTWKLPKDGETNDIPFSIETNKNGKYTLMAEIFLYPDDLSINLKMKIIAYYTDNKISVQYVNINGKKNEWNEYLVSIQTNPNKNLKKIGCKILTHSKSTSYMHIDVKNILLNFKEYEDVAIDSTSLKKLIK